MRNTLAALFTAAALAGPACAVPAAAQADFATATAGPVDEVWLEGGFLPDPYAVTVIAGGETDAAEDPLRAAAGCRGYVTQRPTLVLSYDAGRDLPLIVSAGSRDDTTLVVHGPGGEWRCNNDGGRGLNPSIRWEEPASGVYEIWVGTYLPDQAPVATLHISEITSQ